MDKSDIPRLIKDLGSFDRIVREETVEKLVEIGEPAVPVLIDALKDDSFVMNPRRAHIIKALSKISDERVVPALIDTLKHESFSAREEAANALGKIGDERAVPALIDALKNDDSGVRNSAAGALGKIGDVRAVPGLIEALNDQHVIRKTAVVMLEEIAYRTGDYHTALKIIKDSTQAVMKFYEGDKDRKSLKERRQELFLFESLAQKIHAKMNSEKKRFPVKRQEIRTVRQKVTRSA